MSRSRSMPLAMACDVDALFCVSLRSLFLKLEIRSDYPRYEYPPAIRTQNMEAVP